MSENKELTCAFAVYPNRLTEFLAKRPEGFRDRCDKPYILPDYTPEQMYEIFSEECASEETNASVQMNFLNSSRYCFVTGTIPKMLTKIFRMPDRLFLYSKKQRQSIIPG